MLDHVSYCDVVILITYVTVTYVTLTKHGTGQNQSCLIT